MKLQMLAELRKMIRFSIEARREGALGAHLARHQGAVDGYMSAMLDAGVATQRELLRLVQEERRQVEGPPTSATEANAFAFDAASA